MLVRFYEDQILPRAIDLVMGGAPMAKLRRRAVDGLTGQVVEVGFGSGHNLPLLPEGVAHLTAIDPATLGRRLAARRLAACPVPVGFAELDGTRLGLESDSMDAALSTWTLCTIPDLQAALAELRRVLKPGGQLHFVEHGRAPDAAVARWQDRLNPIHSAFAGGCQLNRAIDEELERAGFELAGLERFYLKKTPRFLGFTYLGRAIAR